MGGWWIRSALNTGIQNTAAAWTSHLGRAKGVAMTHFLDEEASRDRLGLSRGGGHNLFKLSYRSKLYYLFSILFL